MSDAELPPTATRGPLVLDSPPPPAPTGVRALVFLDRDGVLNELVPDTACGRAESPLEADQVRLMPGAAEAVLGLGRAGYLAVCVSNQPAAAKGRVSKGQLIAVHRRVMELLARDGALLAASYLCLHHPEGVIAEFSGRCACRKPAPGMLRDAAAAFGLELRDSWMVGDTDADISAGRAAGCRTAMVCNPDSSHKRLQEMNADVIGSSLTKVVQTLSSARQK